LKKLQIRRKSGASVNRRKEQALKTIRKFEGIPPRGLLSTLSGIHRSTLVVWEKDKKFRDALNEIIDQKKLEAVGRLNKGFDRCVEENHYPAIRDGLRVLDPHTWADIDNAAAAQIELFIGVRQEVIIE